VQQRSLNAYFYRFTTESQLKLLNQPNVMYCFIFISHILSYIMSEEENKIPINVEVFKLLESKSLELSHQFAKQVESIQEQMKQVCVAVVHVVMQH
jgi:hypothetical protein